MMHRSMQTLWTKLMTKTFGSQIFVFLFPCLIMTTSHAEALADELYHFLIHRNQNALKGTLVESI